eukprot:2010545-Amphidinium_carterae.1
MMTQPVALRGQAVRVSGGAPNFQCCSLGGRTSTSRLWPMHRACAPQTQPTLGQYFQVLRRSNSV